MSKLVYVTPIIIEFFSVGIDIDGIDGIDPDSTEDMDSTRAVAGYDDDARVSADKYHQIVAAAGANSGAAFSYGDDAVHLMGVRMCLGDKSFVGDMVIVGGLVFDKQFVANDVERLGGILDAIRS